MGGKAVIHATLAFILNAGCGTSDLTGEPDTTADLLVDDLHAEDTIEAEPPCWDRDDDGYLDEACGGDDCDDSREDVHPGSPDLCGDGIDQDCDGNVDGPRSALGNVVVISEEPIIGSMAWSGSDFLVVWATYRTPLGSLFLSRMDGTGSMHGDTSEISSMIGAVMSLDLAWTGSNLGIAFYEIAEGGGPLTPDEMVNSIFMLSDIDGLLFEEFAISEPMEDQEFDPGIIWAGSYFLAAWKESPRSLAGEPPHTVYSAHIPEEGTRPETETLIAIRDNNPATLGPRTAWTGSEVSIAWTAPEESLGLNRVEPDSSMEATILSLSGYAQGLAWTGSEYGLTFEQDTMYSKQVRLVRVSPDGTLLDEPDYLIDTRYYSGSSSLVWTGSGFAFAWLNGHERACDEHDPYPFLQCNSDVYVTYTDSYGNLLWADVRISENEGWKLLPDLVWTGSELAVMWLEGQDGEGYESASIIFDKIALCE